MVDINKILKQLEKIENPQKKLEFVQNLVKKTKDEDEREELLEILEELFPEEQEDLEHRIFSKTDFSEATLPFKPVFTKETSLEDLVPASTKKDEPTAAEQKYSAIKTVYGREMQEAYKTSTDQYSHEKDEEKMEKSEGIHYQSARKADPKDAKRFKSLNENDDNERW